MIGSDNNIRFFFKEITTSSHCRKNILSFHHLVFQKVSHDNLPKYPLKIYHQKLDKTSFLNVEFFISSLSYVFNNQTFNSTHVEWILKLSIWKM